MIPGLFESFRHGQRFHLSLPLMVRIDENSIPLIAWRKDSALIENTCTENISSHGCYFLLSQELAVGTKVEMEITLPGNLLGVPEGRLCCRGKVLRVENPASSGKVGVASTIDSYHIARALNRARDPRARLVA